MSMNVYTGLKPFCFIHKHFLQICFLCMQLLQFSIHYACVGDHDTLQILTTKSTYRSLSAQRLPERTVLTDKHNHTDLEYWFVFRTAACFGCPYQPSSDRHRFARRLKRRERPLLTKIGVKLSLL